LAVLSGSAVLGAARTKAEAGKARCGEKKTHGDLLRCDVDVDKLLREGVIGRRKEMMRRDAWSIENFWKDILGS
jgi:hypothetical protein